MRKQRIGIFDLGRLPVVPTKYADDEKPTTTLAAFRADEARREQEATIKAERERVKQAESARLAELTSPASVRIAKYWSQPLKEIATNGIDMTPTDLAGDYEIGPRDNATEVTTWKEFKKNLDSSGCTLSDSGGERLGAYLCSLGYHRGVSLVSITNWAKALERLYSLGVFQEEELMGYQTRAIEVEQPRQPAEVDPLAELENLNLDSREGNKKAKQIATKDFFGRQMAPIAQQWAEWLLTAFNYVLTDDARKAAGQWWMNNPTLNPLRAESWTQLRLNLIKRGLMPTSCKSREELLNETIEASSERSDSYEARRNLRQQIRGLAQK
jgi:hypothetical protein